MANGNGSDDTQIPPLNTLVDRLGETLFDVKNLSRLEKAGANALQSALANLIGIVLALAGEAGAFIAETIAKAENEAQPAFNRIAAVAIQDMFGIDIGDINARRGGGGNRAAADAIGEAMFQAFSGQVKGGGGGGELEPSDGPAKTFLSAMAQLALEGWLEGWIVEALSLGQIESFGELDDTISHVLGLGRASAAVHGPLVNHLIVTPLDWKIKKEHRPTLLPVSTLLKNYLDGNFTRAELDEELGRQGYSERRINAIIREALPELSFDDAFTLARESDLGRGYAVSNLRAAGWDEINAELKVQAAEVRRVAAVRDNALTAVIRAFVNNDLTETQFRAFLPAMISNADERATYEQVARVQREVSVQHMTQAEVIDCVELGVFSTADYRRWLEREGYPPDEQAALELRLRVRMSKDRDVAKQRAELEAERAAEKAARLEAAARRQADIERQHELARRGPLAELTKAAVRGRIPLARVEDVLATLYDVDTVAIILGNIEADRSAYLEQQQHAEDARKRGIARRIDVGSLEQAVLADTLTLPQYRGRLGQLGFPADDIDILTATLEARKADLEAARRKRLEAAAKAKTRSIDLSAFEMLVRRGHRSMADYDGLLRSLDFDDPSRAAMIDLLHLKIADDAAARAERAKRDAADPVAGLTLAQFRRAVLLGHATLDEFDQYLVTANFTPRAHELLVAELRDDLAQADAARRLREQADASPEPRRLPLATVRRAARLGIVPPQAYVDRLVAVGYTDDDIAIEMDLLVNEIADVQAARQTATAADAAAPSAALTLAQMASAVRAGVKHLEDYRGLAASTGLSGDAVSTLVRVLGDELAGSNAARVRRHELASELQAKDVVLATLEQAVRDGTLTVQQFASTLTAAGLDPLDVDVLAALVMDERTAAGG